MVRPCSRASHLPHWVWLGIKMCVHHRSLWEQSLLAKAVGQPIEMLDVPPSSRASPLPHGFWCGSKMCVHHRSPVGASLLAIAAAHSTSPPLPLRSEESRVGKECVSTCSSRWSPYH